MKKTDFNLRIITVIFVVSLIISNVVTSKLVATGLYFYDIPIILPGAMVCYALTFLTTDIIGEVWGRQAAGECVKLGLIAQLLALILIQLTKYLPAYDSQMALAYNQVLGQGWLYVLASLIAYYTSQSWDVFVFHKLRKLCTDLTGCTKLKWVWNNVSTITSQLIDTIIFIFIAFGLGLGWLWTEPKMLVVMMFGQYIFKTLLAVIDTPIFYILTKNVEK